MKRYDKKLIDAMNSIVGKNKIQQCIKIDNVLINRLDNCINIIKKYNISMTRSDAIRLAVKLYLGYIK